MKDLDYLKLLSSKFNNRKEAAIEIANLSAILSLPKATEYFFSDLHGEYESFIHLLHSASGIIRSKIKILFGNELTDEEILDLANIVYYPNEKLDNIDFTKQNTFDFQKDLILKLIIVVKTLSAKYTRSKVRKAISKSYVYIIEELLYKDIDTDDKKTKYYDEIIKNIVETGLAKNFITELCFLIQKLAVDTLHIIGDICDRGPRQDLIFEELINFHNVDVEWGNHDIEWMGAFCGNEVLIINALRIAVRYNCFDMLEDGYGINLRRLFDFSYKHYKEANDIWLPKILDENIYDYVDPKDAAIMQKALYIIQLKLEGQLIKKHNEYEMNDRIMLEKIDYDKGTILIDNNEYELIDKDFPTVDKNEPLKLSAEEEELVKSLKSSFMHSKVLKRHIEFLYDKGSLYKIYNGNLLFHGAIPLDKDFEFTEVKDFFNQDKSYSGKALFDYYQNIVVKAYKDSISKKVHSDNIDFMYYLWCGKNSPFFGKDCIKTFELYFVNDKEMQKEKSNPYFKAINVEDIAIKILKEFGLTEKGHIINGHVPVKLKDGESPIKANGRIYVIDGGMSKGYQVKTGIAGYTLIYDSIHMNLATHKPYCKGKFNTPLTEEVESVANGDRIYIKDTDIGKELKKQIEDLKDLIIAFDKGIIQEKK